MLPDPARFAADWVRAWNRRDAEWVLDHFADEVVFTSPMAARVIPDSGGTVRGKAALREYWSRALQGNPDLHFTLVGLYAGIETLVLHYRNHLGGFVSEVLTFHDGLVTMGHATHHVALDPVAAATPGLVRFAASLGEAQGV